MRLILGGINGDYLRNLIEEANVIEDDERMPHCAPPQGVDRKSHISH